MGTKNNNLCVVFFIMFIILQACSLEDNSSSQKNDYSFMKEIQINDNCIYLIQLYGHFNLVSILSLNTDQKIYFNSELVKLNSYNENGIPLKIKRTYTFHLEMNKFPKIKMLQIPDKNLIEKYLKSDSLSSFYSDYLFYFPKEDKMCWINIFDGINETERKALIWIEKNITTISIEENVNYLMLAHNKRSYTDLNPDKLKRWYIIPQRELSGIPTYFRKFEGNYFKKQHSVDSNIPNNHFSK